MPLFPTLSFCIILPNLMSNKTVLVRDIMKIHQNIFFIILLNLIVQTQLRAMEKTFVFDYGAATVKGTFNECNEDHHFCHEIDDVNGPAIIAAIFDGHNGGKVAKISERQPACRFMGKGLLLLQDKFFFAYENSCH